MQMRKSVMEEEVILKKMGLKKTLQNTRENYREQQKIWEREGVQTFRDFNGTTTKMSNLHLRI